MSWLVGNWRLKLLAVGLALVLLGAVAISENPPELSTLAVGVSYQNLSPDLVLVSPPTSVKVTVVGLSDAVRQFSQTSVGAIVDLDHVRPGSDQTLQARVSADTSNISLQTPTVPVQLTIERVATKQLPVDVRVTNVDSTKGVWIVSGKTYATCGSDTDSCRVLVTAPESFFSGLKAYVDFDARITAPGSQFAPALPLMFEQNGRRLDLAAVRTEPSRITFAPSVVTAHVQIEGGELTKQVAVVVSVSGSPACGYHVDGFTIAPGSFAFVSGPVELVNKISAIHLDPISISGATGNETFSRALSTGSDAVRVTDPASGTVDVTVNVSKSFNC